MTGFQPFYKQVQAHYDLSNEFFALFLDPSMVYSCAFFAREDMTLHEAQMAKIDLSLGKCDLPIKVAAGRNPAGNGAAGGRLKLLDIGCGWGACARRAASNFHVDVVGLTLSKRQHEFDARSLADLPPGAGRVEFRLQGWEEFDEPVDRIVSIGAFEHFRRERYSAFFERAFELLPRGGRMMLHSIMLPDLGELNRRGIAVDHEAVIFAKFIGRNIFPGGQLCSPQVVIEHAVGAGFSVAHSESLQPHYARTLEIWAGNLESNRDRAVALTSQDNYDMYMHYLTGCARYFRTGHIDVMQFTLVKPN